VPYVRISVRGPDETGRSPIEALSFPFGKRIAPTHPAHFTPVNIIPPETNPARENPFYPRDMSVFLPQVIKAVEDETWLTTEAQFDTIYPSLQTFLMDRFYRAMRKHTGLLMEAGKPIGGKFSYDHENREPFRGEVRVPNRPSYPPDEITTEVLCLVELYWSFLERSGDQLSGNQRMAMPNATLREKPPAERKALRERAIVAIEELERVPRPDYEPAGER
jgi:deoxyribodipyrimidine photolyase-like uncharacterized protein